MSKALKLPSAPPEMRELAHVAAAAVVNTVGALDAPGMQTRVIVVADATRSAGYELARAMLRQVTSVSDEVVCARLDRRIDRSHRVGQRHVEARLLTHDAAKRLFDALNLNEETRDALEAWLTRPPPTGGARVLAVSETIGLLHVTPEGEPLSIH